MILLTGLGNPGLEYKNTRHNTGFITIDKIKDYFNFPDFKEKNKFLFSKLKINNTDVILLKPTTFMNLSGEAVLSVTSMYKIKPDDTIIIHDDLDLKTARIKIKCGGSAGGHNGLKSIDKAIGQNYHRIRIGIDHPRNYLPIIDVSNYVLSNFSNNELKLINKSIDIIIQNFEKILSKEFNKIILPK